MYTGEVQVPPTAVVDFPESSTSGIPSRQLFRSPRRVLRATTLAEVIPVLDQADRHARSGGWSVGMVAYEAAPAFDPALAAMPRGRLPLAWFALFDEQAAESVAAGKPVCIEKEASLAEALGGTSREEYGEGVRRIREYILMGDVYQVNLTVPFELGACADPFALYERMRAAQRGPYSAFLDLGDARVMSASPELFFDRRGSMVGCRPMKGTAPRALTLAADSAARDALVSSEKDRAENLMIVDLTRNDLGRIGRLGSVRVTSLCEPERYPGVWQLTSAIEAEVPASLPLSSVFSALFPAGSITGAPKIRATEIIKELESRPREAYCGAIGVIRPGGDATFNVAIRTAWMEAGSRTAHLDAGGAITIDSSATAELAEVRAKLSAFTTPRPTPCLFETLRVEFGVPQRLGRHLGRLADSAAYFGIPFDEGAARGVLLDAAGAHEAVPCARARLILRNDACLRATVEPFASEVASEVACEPRLVGLAERAVDRGEWRLYHKTLDRRIFDEARMGQERYFDTLLVNGEGEVTEFTRGNVVVELDGGMWTPPVACGLLGGVLRGEVVEAGTVRERVILMHELRRATRLWFINALRGWIAVTPDPRAWPVTPSRTGDDVCTPARRGLLS